MKEFIKKYYILIIVALVIVGGTTAFLVNAAKNRPAASDLYDTALLEKGDLVATVGATGSVRSNQTALLGWKVSGIVAEVLVDAGQVARKGETLASLQKSSLPQQVILAEADLAAARQALDDLLNSGTAEAQAYIALDEAERAYETAKENRAYMEYNKIEFYRIRYKTITTYSGNKKTVPRAYPEMDWADEETLKEADTDLALKKARYEDALRNYNRIVEAADLPAAEARVAAAEAALSAARITAPFTGTVTDVIPVPGDQVDAGTMAFRLDDLSRLLVDVELSEVDVNSVSEDQGVLLGFDAILDETYRGVVIEVSPVGDVVEGVVNFTITVEITDADEQVKPGMTAAVTITVRELNDVLLVPNRAVRVLEGKQVVVRLYEDGATEVVDVRLGASGDVNSVVVGGDLEAGDTVILSPPAELLGLNMFGPPGQ